jgi:hypothetical protein
VTPEELRELPDAEFFSYLDRLDRQPDAPAETLSDAWAELEIRRALIAARIRAECASTGMTREQIDELKQCVRKIFSVREDEV